MNDELATHISLLAAPIYAALVVGEPETDRPRLRRGAIRQALALWKQALEEKSE